MSYDKSYDREERGPRNYFIFRSKELYSLCCIMNENNAKVFNFSRKSVFIFIFMRILNNQNVFRAKDAADAINTSLFYHRYRESSIKTLECFVCFIIFIKKKQFCYN